MSRTKPTPPHSTRAIHDSGWRRVVYRGRKLLWKIQYPTHTMSILGRDYSVPMAVCGLKRFGSIDMNIAEWKNYTHYFQHVPPAFRKYFAPIQTIRRRKGNVFLGMEAVRNDDGTISQSLEHFGKVRDPVFWNHFHRLVEWLISRGIPFFDIRSPNFLVQKKSGGLIPVLIDYKTASMNYYLFRPWYLVPALRADFMRKRLLSLEKQYWEI
ncbi:MAG: hypothetical protein V1776_01925 [Candidatus Diapherotrites archaeon]